MRAWAEGSGEWRMRITRDVASEMGLSQKELFDDALYTCSIGNPAILITLDDSDDAGPHNYLEDSGTIPPDARSPFYILTTQGYRFGAAALYYRGVRETIAERFGEGYYAVPTSVHEFMIVPDSSGTPPEKLRELLEYSNQHMLPPEDILADDLYHYDYATQELCTNVDLRHFS